MASTKVYNLARMSTATTGTGTLTLDSAVSGYLTFSLAGVSDGETVRYAIKDGANSEIGTGVYTASGTTLTRVVEKSTNSDSAISLSGTAEVFITPSKKDFALGLQSIYIPAGAMRPTTTNGALYGIAELATNDVMRESYAFDTTTSEKVQFDFCPPKAWDLGTMTFRAHWTAASGSGTVDWVLALKAAVDDDALDAAFGTGQISGDTLITANDEHVAAVSAAITAAGSPAAGCRLLGQVSRNVGTDNLGVDALLLGIEIFFTVNAGNDT